LASVSGSCSASPQRGFHGPRSGLLKLLDLAKGGMGTVELGLRREGGFRRLYAVKRLGWSAFATPIPGAPSLSALRGVADGSWYAGAMDGSVWKFAPGSSWTNLGMLPVPVTDLGLDSGGGLWACAAAIYKLAGGVFTKFDIGTSWIPHRFLIEGATPSWSPSRRCPRRSRSGPRCRSRRARAQRRG
jgi:hypothetical protein